MAAVNNLVPPPGTNCYYCHEPIGERYSLHVDRGPRPTIIFFQTVCDSAQRVARRLRIEDEPVEEPNPAIDALVDTVTEAFEALAVEEAEEEEVRDEPIVAAPQEEGSPDEPEEKKEDEPSPSPGN